MTSAVRPSGAQSAFADNGVPEGYRGIAFLPVMVGLTVGLAGFLLFLVEPMMENTSCRGSAGAPPPGPSVFCFFKRRDAGFWKVKRVAHNRAPWPDGAESTVLWTDQYSNLFGLLNGNLRDTFLGVFGY